VSVAAITCLLIIAYTYVGYPLLILLWARLAPSVVRGRDGYEPTVSICLAVHDGAAYIDEKIRSLQALEYPPEKLELLIFSDGSTDDTAARVQALSVVDPRIRLLRGAERRGKPSALNRLRAAATGEVLLMCDVRQPLSAGSLRSLVHALSDPAVGCVSGRLVLGGNTGAGLYWRYEHMIRCAEARMGCMVGVSGSIYVVRRHEMPDVPEDVLLDDMFVPLELAMSRRKRTVLAERAEAYDQACDDGHEFPRKVRTLAGNYQLIARMPRLLVPGASPVWFQMLSHKVLRLACPWALFILFFASATLATDPMRTPMDVAFWRTVFSAQVAFYVLAALGPRVRSAGSVPRTFLVLNAAAVLGSWRFLRGSQAITW
jgi:cellulose synthase/poly-beta-1,6-N-acetylglucosamine synthase-like glycosyltransferase